MKQKKNILFIMGKLDSGGVSKSMLSLLNVIDKEGYNISLLLINTTGVFTNNVPKGVEVLLDKRLTALTNGVRGVAELMRWGYWGLVLASLFKLFLASISKVYAGLWLAKIMPRIVERPFDLIIDYGGQHQLYYMVDKLNGKKKITFFHNDYRKWNYYEKADRQYFFHVDGIYTISETCVNALREVFPEYADKVRLMENILSPTLIVRLADEPCVLKSHQYLFISLGHVCRRKGSDLALHVAGQLWRNKIDFEWWFIGNMSEDCDYLQLAKEENVVDRVKFLGMQSNPYPYLKKADIVVHLSQYEGKSIALDEAKLLCKPIVVANYSTVRDQFTDHLNGSICERNVESATKAITELLENEILRQSYIEYLKFHINDNSEEINKIYNLVRDN